MGTAPKTHTCAAKGCSRAVVGEQLMCWPHWRSVPRAAQQVVWRTWRAYNAATPDNAADRWQAYMVARKAAIDAVAAAPKGRP